jgi:multiple sugar transport system permease protein
MSASDAVMAEGALIRSRWRRAAFSPGRIALSVFLVVAGVLMLLPVVWVVLQSFELPADRSSVAPVWFPSSLTLGSYRTLFSTTPFWLNIVN